MSSLHGIGIRDLLDMVIALLGKRVKIRKQDSFLPDRAAECGKSTLANTIMAKAVIVATFQERPGCHRALYLTAEICGN